MEVGSWIAGTIWVSSAALRFAGVFFFPPVFPLPVAGEGAGEGGEDNNKGMVVGSERVVTFRIS